MINKQISLGTIITIITIIGTFIFTQGATSTRIENIDSKSDENKHSIASNKKKVQNLEIGQERIETKVDAIMNSLNRLETLIMEN